MAGRWQTNCVPPSEVPGGHVQAHPELFLGPSPSSHAAAAQSTTGSSEPALADDRAIHLAILTQYYPPEIGAPQARLSSLAEALVRRGHRVTVVTALPNYPGGKIQKGYRGLVRQEYRHGVRVIRSWLIPTRRADMLPRLACYCSFAASSALVGTALLQRPDYLMVESPPLFLGPTGLLLARLKGARLIFNVSDLWPDSAVRLGVVREGSMPHRLSAALEARCYRGAWLVTGQTRDIVDDIGRRFPGTRTFHLPNGVDCRRFGPEKTDAASRRLVQFEGRCTALYAGLHGLAQGLDQVLDAAAVIPPSGGLEFVLMGNGPLRESLIHRAQSEGLAHVRFLDPRPHAEVPGLLAAADIIIVPLHQSLTNAVPSKLYEALASGKPVVLIAGGEAARIVRDGEAGIVVPHNDRAGLAAALLRLAGDAGLRNRMGMNGRRIAAERFDRSRIAASFLGVLQAGLTQRERVHA
jgi:glycosyltransferase involved in cell wall biosynthesis